MITLRLRRRAHMAWSSITALSVILLMLASCSSSKPVPRLGSIPPLAQRAGYLVRTYGPVPTLLPVGGAPPSAGVALLRLANFFGNSVPVDSVVANTDGSITLLGGGASNGQVASATSAANADKFEGVAFGGGAYFEATLKFDGWQDQSSNPNSTSTGWPAFWSMSIEHLAQNGTDQWPGQPIGYEHFVEIDFLEYDLAYAQKTNDVYNGSIHDSHGVYKQTCAPSSYCEIQNRYSTKIKKVPANTDFSAYHTYGLLWVPATATADGYAQWYFDGEEVGRAITWELFTNQSPASTSAAMNYGILDLQHLVVILGTGLRYPMTVSAVSVWQKSADGNVIGK